jgi:hypothetical protein
MAAFPNLRVRIQGDLALLPTPINILTTLAPRFAAGDSVQFEVTAFNNGVCVTDISGVTSFGLQIIPLAAGNAPPAYGATPSFSKTQTSLDNTTTGVNWLAGTNQQAVFTLVTADTSGLTPGGYWLRLIVTSSDGTPRIIEICSGYFLVTAA